MRILVGYGVCKPVDEGFKDSDKVDEPDDAGDDDCIALGQGLGAGVLHGCSVGGVKCFKGLFVRVAIAALHGTHVVVLVVKIAVDGRYVMRDVLVHFAASHSGYDVAAVAVLHYTDDARFELMRVHGVVFCCVIDKSKVKHSTIPSK